MMKTRLTKAEKALQKSEIETRRAARQEEVSRALQFGCPQCGRKIRRNLSLTGWWQCSQLGAEGFRADPTMPSCSWQTFTE